MKVLLGSLVLMLVLLSANGVTPVAAAVTGGSNVEVVMANFGALNFFYNRVPIVETCYVRTQGGNLNVRNARGRIIGELPNGTEVNLVTRVEESTSVIITADIGNRTIEGLVDGSYIDCGH